MRSTITSSNSAYQIIDLPRFAGEAFARLPWLHRVLVENVLRRAGDDRDAMAAIPDWLATGSSEAEVPFYPTRVLMHDTTCGPALVDVAASRSALAEAGGDPAALNPVLPVDVSTDHSIAVDYFAVPDAARRNMERELQRNLERFRFMKWATRALRGVNVHPPGTGIMHTINLERLATVVTSGTHDGAVWAYPDTLIGTDSHTPMINGIGVLAWGVGGLEAESVLFGMPVMMRVPEVVGVRFSGRLREGVTPTDLALTVTHRLRQIELAGRFVEYFGPGVSTLSCGDRIVVANMAPEYGSSTGYFPIDERTIEYLQVTGRSVQQAALVRDYARRQQLWFDPHASPTYAEVIEIDLDKVTTSVAGPRRPQDLLSPGDTGAAIAKLSRKTTKTPIPAPDSDSPPDGAVAIAAITSCTNTSSPRLLVTAGLLARKARKLGLKPKPWVKTSLAPGSPTAHSYLQRAGLLEDLEALGFNIVGYGCTTCIGNSGDLTEPIVRAMNERGIVPVAILSGNRNFPGRVHPQLEAGLLASPPLVIAYALAGDVNLNILMDALGKSRDGQTVRLVDLWPSGSEIDAALAQASSAADYQAAYEKAEATDMWRTLDAPATPLYLWDPASTYIRRPPFAAVSVEPRVGHYTARPILIVGDDVTTDHISPAGAVPAGSEAAKYLIERGENPRDLNVFSARRGNWEAMVRGLFTNKTVKNLLDPALKPGQTMHMPSGDILPLWDAAERYRAEGVPVILLAGERYGMGSSRDWAAKGVALLGVRAVLAAGFERIHRSNLVNMGVLPLRLPKGRHPANLNVGAADLIEVLADPDALVPRADIQVRLRRADGRIEEFTCKADVETNLEVRVLLGGGIIPVILKDVLARSQSKELSTGMTSVA
jgi:aconitate hydratase